MTPSLVYPPPPGIMIQGGVSAAIKIQGRGAPEIKVPWGIGREAPERFADQPPPYFFKWNNYVVSLYSVKMQLDVEVSPPDCWMNFNRHCT